MAAAKQSGASLDTQKKFAGGANKQAGGPVVSARKLEDEDGEGVKLQKASVDLKNQIQQARQVRSFLPFFSFDAGGGDGVLMLRLAGQGMDAEGAGGKNFGAGDRCAAVRERQGRG